MFFQGNPSDSIYFVRTGIVSIVLNSSDGRELVIDEVRAGQVFGYLEAVTRKTRVMGAAARSNGELLVIPCGAFLDVLDDEPLLARRSADNPLSIFVSS